MDNQKQIKQNNSSSKKLVRNLIIAVAAILVLSVMFWFLSQNNAGRQISGNAFEAHLQSGAIKNVNINAKTIEVEYNNGEKAWLYNSNDFGSTVISLCQNYNASNNPDVTYSIGSATTFSILSLIYPILILGTSIVLFIFIARQIKGANNKSFDFVKNRAVVSASTVKFDSVAGADEEKQEVQEIIEFLKDPQRFNEIGARIPKGVLLVGPPGTGKTLLARAIAGEANVPFFTISGSDFMELFVGVGASRVRDLFVQAKKVKPCIVFIDEIDAVGRQRGAGMGGGNDEREQTLNQLLVQMDGFEANEGIIVIAATNRADILDPALLRPGRFDRQIYIHIPDVRGREAILNVHAKNKKFDKSADLKSIARITSGFTGADLENLLNEAAILAARENRKRISQKDLSESIDKVLLGPQKRSWVITDRDKEITAYHEAGHAIIGKYVKNNDKIHEVSIIPRGKAAGYTLSRPDNDENHITKTKLTENITMLLGGRVAEEMFLKDISTGASNDLERATEIARSMVSKWGMSEKIGLVNYGESDEVFIGRDYQTRAKYSDDLAKLIDQEIKAIIDSCKQEAIKILTANKKKVQTLVDVLKEKETVYADEVEKIFEGDTAEEVIKYIDSKLEKEKLEEHDKSLTSIVKISPEQTEIEPEKTENKETKNDNSEEKDENGDEKPSSQEKPKRNIIRNDASIPENIADAIKNSKKDKE